ncbi:hypothetical protein [Marinactinospora rubrisoli]|uniref:DNA-binding phage zinc finger domain-containing protein n=1 Tax=Marinactinospora rubrisoli TaxID=2715399 RepID=A0ABW2KNB0_9ACTN
MTPTEATTLARLARAACPQQHFDEFTPDIWFDLLGDIGFDDAKQGLLAATRTRAFVSPAEIRAEVKKIRAERMKNSDLALPPAHPDARDYSQQFRAQLRALADGKRVDEVLALEPGSVDAVPPTGVYAEARGADYVRRRTALSVPCRICGMDALRPCRVVGVGRRDMPTGYHQERLDEALRLIADGDPEPAAEPDQPAPVTAVHRAKWCGKCNQDTRTVPTPDLTARVPCPACGTESAPAA